jgi:pyruvate dehydrogenase E2 component (dihydrolipoamide acetyltransferase)
MAISVVMPALEMAQETGKLLAWRKKEGERVTKGEPLLEIETDKAVVEIEAPADGVLAGVKSHEGAVVPVGETIAWIVAPGEQPPAASIGPQGTARATTIPSRPSAAVVAPEPSSSPGVQISPKARRLAKERGVDIGQVRGTGPEGSITSEDILAAVPSQTAATPSVPSLATKAGALSSIARLMAERTTESWTTVPHFSVVREVHAEALVEAHKKSIVAIEKLRGVRPSLTDFLVGLTARVLAKHAVMNSSWIGEGVRANADINISLAMAVGEGVVAAVIQRANSLDLGEIASQRNGLAERARAGRLRPSDIAGGTFTISNLGMHEVDSFTAIITPPQVAILAVGAIVDRVVAVDGKPAIRPRMTLTLSSDHRVVDGARAAAFLNDLSEAIRETEKWLR